MRQTKTPTVEIAGMHLARFVPCPIDSQPRTVGEMLEHGDQALIVRWAVYDLQEGRMLEYADGKAPELDSYFAAEIDSDMAGNIQAMLESHIQSA